MKIPDRVTLLQKFKRVIAEVNQQSAEFMVHSFVDVCEHSEERESGWKYHVQLICASEEIGPTVVNFGKDAFPSFEHKDFDQMIRMRYKDHVDEDTRLMITNLEPEEAVDLVVSVIEEYADYLAGLGLLS